MYLDSAATAQKPFAVIDAIRKFHEVDCANIHRGVHELSQRSTAAYEETRIKAKRFLNARAKNEMIFVRGTTEGINLVASQLGPQEREARRRDRHLGAWSTTPTSCPGKCCAKKRAPSCASFP